jgi:hypothetical protein
MKSICHVPPEDHQSCPPSDASRYVLAQVSRWARTSEPVHPLVAMEIASWWHSPAPRDSAITAFASHGEVMLDDLLRNVLDLKIYCDLCSQPDCPEIPPGTRVALGALRDYVDTVVRRDTRYRTLLSTSHGHRWMGTDNPGQESCLTCGGVWTLAPDLEYDPDGGYGSYFASNGDHADECSGDTSREHGYERHCDMGDSGRSCEAFDETGTCVHTGHDCNCVGCQ